MKLCVVATLSADTGVTIISQSEARTGLQMTNQRPGSGRVTRPFLLTERNLIGLGARAEYGAGKLLLMNLET